LRFFIAKTQRTAKNAKEFFDFFFATFASLRLCVENGIEPRRPAREQEGGHWRWHRTSPSAQPPEEGLGPLGGSGVIPSDRGFVMTRINLLLLVALVISSVYLVRVSYESRRLFAALDRAQSESRQLDIEHERLKAEKQSQATPLRVERVARDRLAMRSATPAVTQYVTYGAAASAVEGAR
jgi:cell division protein FtsL